MARRGWCASVSYLEDESHAPEELKPFPSGTLYYDDINDLSGESACRVSSIGVRLIESRDEDDADVCVALVRSVVRQR
jgi:hypothetical protein